MPTQGPRRTWCDGVCSCAGRMASGMAFIHEIEDDVGRRLATLVTTHDAYLLPDGSERFVGTAPAWCRRCGQFVTVEKLEGPEELERQAREFCGHRAEHLLFPAEIIPLERQRE